MADLLERELTGSLSFGNRGGYERLWLGQAIHSRYQEEAAASDGSYRREVVVTSELTHRGWEVFALEGIPSGQYRARAAERQALENKVESLETAVNRELKSPVRLNAHQWKKY